MNEQRLNEIRARLDALASTHWHLRTRHTSSTKELCSGEDHDWYGVVRFQYDVDGPYIAWYRWADLDFAVNAPTDIAFLLAELEKKE